MQLGVTGGRHTFEHLLNEVNTPARSVELVTQQLVSGASGRAKAAVHAFAQNRFSLLAVGCVLVFGGELSLHGFSEKAESPCMEHAMRVKLFL